MKAQKKASLLNSCTILLILSVLSRVERQAQFVEPFGVMRRAIYPGSFDPVTNGHLDVIERRENCSTKSSWQSRIMTRNNRFSRSSNVWIYCESGPNQNVRIADRRIAGRIRRPQNAGAVIRGLRAVSDFEFEFQMALMNRKLNAGGNDIPDAEGGIHLPQLAHRKRNREARRGCLHFCSGLRGQSAWEEIRTINLEGVADNMMLGSMKIHLKQIPSQGLHLSGEEDCPFGELASEEIRCAGPLHYNIDVGVSDGGLWANGSLPRPVELRCVSAWRSFVHEIECPRSPCTRSCTGRRRST